MKNYYNELKHAFKVQYYTHLDSTQTTQQIMNTSQQGCGSGSGFRDFVDQDPDPGARKLRNYRGKMHFLVIFKKKFYH
jgi:hypothetical protein